jgi:ribosomal protein S18 acetylase RimI-like enzyme
VTELEWDTRFFGVRIAQADETAELDAEVAAAGDAGVELLYVRVPGADATRVEHAVRRGARLVDLRAELDRAGEPPEAPAGTRRASAADLPAVERGARQLSAASRFAADPRIAAERVAEMYLIWARACLEGGVVVLPEDGAGGFVGATHANGETRLDLVWVDPSRAGRGLGRTLVDAALAAAPAPRARVVTSATNVPAMRLYESAGFRTRSVDALLHLWLDEAA